MSVLHILKESNGSLTLGPGGLPSHSMIHRADLLRILYEQAVKMGVDVRFLVSIASIHDSPHQPTVKLVDGTNLQPDLLIGADGQLRPW